MNDGSTDNTLESLIQAFDLTEVPIGLPGALSCEPSLACHKSTSTPRLLVVDKPNGGKGDALNAGINFSGQPLICAIDADSLLEGEALLRITRPFLNDTANTVAVGVVSGAERPGLGSPGAPVVSVLLTLVGRCLLADHGTTALTTASKLNATGWTLPPSAYSTMMSGLV